MSKRFNYVILLLVLLCSLLSFVFGVYSISYADERISFNQFARTDVDELTIRLNELFYQTRGLNDFTSYYNNFTWSDLQGTEVETYLNQLTTYQDFDNYIKRVLNITNYQYNSYFIQMTISHRMIYFNIENDNELYYLSNYEIRRNQNNYKMYIRLEYARARDNYTGLTYNYYGFNNNDELITNNTDKIKFIVVDTTDINTLYYRTRLFTINNISNDCLFNIPIKQAVIENNIITYNEHNYTYTNNNNNITTSITGIEITQQSRTETNYNYPINITEQGNVQTITNFTYTNNLIEINIEVITIPYGYDNVYYIITKHSIEDIGIDVIYNIDSLPFIYDFGETPIVPLVDPVITVSNNILTWSAVPNADFYKIKRVSDNQTFYVDNYTSLSYVLSVNGSYSVQACTNQVGYSNSDFSNVIVITSFADTEYSFLLLMSAIMDSILMLFKSFLNYEIFGVNMFSAFGVILFICLVLALLRFIRGRQ